MHNTYFLWSHASVLRRWARTTGGGRQTVYIVCLPLGTSQAEYVACILSHGETDPGRLWEILVLICAENQLLLRPR